MIGEASNRTASIMWMEVAVAAIIAIVTAAAVAIAVLFCVYRLITLLGDPVNTKIEAEINEDKAELKDMSAKLDKARRAGED